MKAVIVARNSSYFPGEYKCGKQKCKEQQEERKIVAEYRT